MVLHAQHASLAWMVGEVAVELMLDALKVPPQVDGDREGAISDGFGGRNFNAMAAIE